MARYTYDLVLNKPEDFVQFVVNDFLQKNRFETADYNGEAVYRAGDPHGGGLQVFEMVLHRRRFPCGGVAERTERRDGSGRIRGNAPEEAVQRKSGAALCGSPAADPGSPPGRAPRQVRVCSRAPRQVRVHSRCRFTRLTTPRPQPWQWCLES